MKKQLTPFDVKNHAIACKVLKLDPKKFPNPSDQLVNIAKAMNKLDKFKADFKNPNQEKWHPCFYVNSSGFRFGHSHYGHDYSFSVVGSRLCFYFRNREICDFFANQHFKLHKKSFYR